jgi:uncharacterized protein YqeY
MSLTEKINDHIKKAMLAKDKDRLAALRDIKSKLLLEATSGAGEVTEATEIKIVNKLYKQRMESYELYKQQNREDLAQDEIMQAEVLKEFLPQMMSEDEIRAAVQAKIAELGISSPKEMGKLMGALTQALAGKADGKVVADMVKEELNKG